MGEAKEHTEFLELYVPVSQILPETYTISILAIFFYYCSVSEP